MMMLFDSNKTEDFEDTMGLYSVISGSKYIQLRLVRICIAFMG